MPLIINGIDRAVGQLPTIFDVPFSGGVTNVLCLPYTHFSPGDNDIVNGETLHSQRIRRVREAVRHINRRIRNYAPANQAFRRTPRGQSLDELLGTTDIFVCMDPTNLNVLAASPVLLSTPARVTDVRISITALGFSGTGRSVEATILHELGHICGTGHVHNPRGNVGAEHILRHTRMGDQFQRGTDTVVPSPPTP